MHFFHPVHKMPLVEVIRGEKSPDATVATIFALARDSENAGRRGRPARFLVNGFSFRTSEAVRLVREGCRIEEVDMALTDFGMPVGPLALLDDVGLDVAVKAGEVLPAAFPQRIKPGGDEASWRAGTLGGRAGAGFYDYRGKRGAPSPAAYEAFARSPSARRPYSPRRDRVAARCCPMVTKRRSASDGVVRRRELDLAMIMGTAFPPFREGTLRWADSSAFRACGRCSKSSPRIRTPLRARAEHPPDGRRP